MNPTQQSSANPNPNPLQEQQGQPPPPAKRRRSLPGTPDPAAEVVALSPRSLMTKNRYVCDACGKGFQREQNLQLHRRGHNLPWRLRQRGVGAGEARKKVYVCPVEECVHHEPARALGDLTGIKKHYSRKHGEKRWKCDKCAKKYAVQSDWKVHCRTCGTRQYTCDCGTVFARKDSFITHRAFCDALVQETARISSAAADNRLAFDPTDGFHRPAVPEEYGHHLSAVHLPNAHRLLPPQMLNAPDAAMSATSLLQQAARMDAVGSCTSSSLFAGFAEPPRNALVGEQQQQLEYDYWNGGGGAELTRDFLGVRGEVDSECFRQPFASPELAGLFSPFFGASMFKTCN